MLSLRQPSEEKCRASDASLLSSGYAGDEENSEVSLVGGTPTLRLQRRLRAPAVSTPTSQLCAVYSPNQIRSRLASRACSSKQPGGEK